MRTHLSTDAVMPDDPPPVTQESILAAKRAQVKERAEFEHAKFWPHGCPTLCDACLIRVKLHEAFDILAGRTMRLPSIHHLRALDLHYRLLTGERS